MQNCEVATVGGKMNEYQDRFGEKTKTLLTGLRFYTENQFGKFIEWENA